MINWLKKVNAIQMIDTSGLVNPNQRGLFLH